MKIYLLAALGIGILGLSVGTFGQTANIPLYYLNGNIGVGITNPASKLDVYSSTTAISGPQTILHIFGESSNTPDDTFAARILFQTKARNTNAYDVGGFGGSNSPMGSNYGDAVIYSRNNGALTEYMRVAGTGFVGMGTSYPEVKLDVRAMAATVNGIQTVGSFASDVAGAPGPTFGGRVVIGVKAANGNSYSVAGFGGANSQYGSSYGDAIIQSLNNGALTEYVRLTSGGKVGIGTTSPGSILHVAGTGSELFRLDRTSTVVSNYRFHITTDMAGDSSDLQVQADANSSGYSFRSRNSGGSSVFGLGINGDGNVGIGTAGPDSKLHIFGTGAEFVAAHFQNGSGGSGIATIKIGGGTPEVQYGILGEYGVDNSFRIGAVGPAGNHNLQFHTGNTSGTQLSSERMRITDAGNVGIGTATPLQLLDVAGTVNMKGITVGYEQPLPMVVAKFSNSSGANGVDVEPIIQINNGGNIGAEHYFNRDTASVYIQNRQAGDIRFLSNTTHRAGEIVRFKDNGNVGIGTTTPTERLDVNGNANVSGTVRASQIIVTTESWADYVFEPDYRLMPLADVRQFIATTKHLPEIPSESDLKKTGTDINKMQALQMKKIEELTLYILQLEDRIKALEARQSR